MLVSQLLNLGVLLLLDRAAVNLEHGCARVESGSKTGIDVLSPVLLVATSAAIAPLAWTLLGFIVLVAAKTDR